MEDSRFIKRLQRFDVFPKALDDVRERANMGGLGLIFLIVILTRDVCLANPPPPISDPSWSCIDAFPLDL